jgi:hypothetical protein
MKFRDKINGGWSGAMEWEGQRRPVNVGTRKLASHRRSSFHRGGMELKDRQRRAAAPTWGEGAKCEWCSRARGITQVSLGIPPVSIIFFLFFNLKISRYVRDMYPGVSGQYPVSEQYPIPVRRRSEVSTLPSSKLSKLKRRLLHEFELLFVCLPHSTNFLHFSYVHSNYSL